MKKRARQVLIFLMLTPVILSGCNRPARILVITGGHEFDTVEFFNLFASLENTRFDTLSHAKALDLISKGKTDRYNLLLFYDYIPIMPLEDSLVYLELTQKGIPLIFLHHAICNFQNWDGYRQIVGGKYTIPEFQPDSTLHSGYRHDIDIPVEVLDPDHPVTRGIADFTIHDEGYSNLQVNDDAYPLLGTTHADCAPLLAWVNHYQNSTSVYLALGHDRVAYSDKNFRSLLYNSIQWLSHEK